MISPYTTTANCWAEPVVDLRKNSRLWVVHRRRGPTNHRQASTSIAYPTLLELVFRGSGTAVSHWLSKPKTVKLGSQINTGKTITNPQKHLSEAIAPKSQRATLLFSALSRMTNHLPIHLSPTLSHPSSTSKLSQLSGRCCSFPIHHKFYHTSLLVLDYKQNNHELYHPGKNPKTPCTVHNFITTESEPRTWSQHVRQMIWWMPPLGVDTKLPYHHPQLRQRWSGSGLEEEVRDCR
jgi:hypothetical protein